MNLVIDCFKLVKGAGKSIGIYNLAKSVTIHLGERALREQDSIFVFGNAYNRKDFEVPGVTFVEMPGNPLNKVYCILWELFLIKHYAGKYQADRVLFPRGYRPLGRMRHAKDTIIIHDLIPFYYHEHYPEVFHKLENAYIMNRLKASIRGADRIITISDFSKRDILKRVPGCEGKIAVINNGCNDVSYQGSPDKTNDYIVAMTSGLPHKNAKGILKTYEQYFRQVTQPLDLTVIGIGDTSCYPELDTEAAGHIKFYKFIEQFDQMCQIVSGAKAYLFLSYVEGFGFPPLEAMQLGVPVVCSNCSSLPEVVGDAGMLADPDDILTVVGALERVTTDEGLRNELVAKGHENVKRFSWESRTDLYWRELFR